MRSFTATRVLIVPFGSEPDGVVSDADETSGAGADAGETSGAGADAGENDSMKTALIVGLPTPLGIELEGSLRSP
jgi:hypothetical protein